MLVEVRELTVSLLQSSVEALLRQAVGRPSAAASKWSLVSRALMHSWSTASSGEDQQEGARADADDAACNTTCVNHM